jgi:predicted secreted protein
VSLTTAAAIYFIIWWVVIFAVLPWGIRSQHEGSEMTPGTEPGAPIAPRIVAKLVWTTVVATGIFAILVVVMKYRLVTLEDFDELLGLRKY